MVWITVTVVAANVDTNGGRVRAAVEVCVGGIPVIVVGTVTSLVLVLVLVLVEVKAEEVVIGTGMVVVVAVLVVVLIGRVIKAKQVVGLQVAVLVGTMSVGAEFRGFGALSVGFTR